MMMTMMMMMMPLHVEKARAVHILSHSPQPAGFTLAAGCTRDDFSLPRSLVSLLLARLQQLAGSCMRNLLFIPGCKAPHPHPLRSTFHLALPKASDFPHVYTLESLHIPNAILP
jgi:hypothetical protein